MSLNYDYIFSQIDKAKKKEYRGKPTIGNTGRRADGSVPWNSPLSRQHQAEGDARRKKEEAEIERTGGRVSQRRYRNNPKDTKTGKRGKPSLHRGTLSDMKLDEKTGKVTGGGKSGVGTPYKDEDPYVAGPKAYRNVRPAASSSKLTPEERKRREDEKASDRKLTDSKIEQKKRRGKVQISDLPEGESHGDTDTKTVDETYRKIQELKRQSKEHHKKEEEEKKKKKPTWASGIRDIQSESENPAPSKQRAGGGGLSSSPHLDEKTLEEKLDEGRRGLSRPTVRDADEADAKAEDEKRTEKLERLREAAGRKTGIRGHETLEPGWWKKQDPKGEKKKDPKPKGLQGGDEHVEEVQSEAEAEDESVYTEAYKEKALWKSWLKKVSMSRMQQPKNTKQDKKRKEQQEKMERKRKLVGTLKKPIKWNVESPEEEESWEHFKERQEASDKKTLEPKPQEEKPKQHFRGTDVEMPEGLAEAKIERKRERKQEKIQRRRTQTTKPEDKKEPAISPKPAFFDVESEAREDPKKKKEPKILPKEWYKEHAEWLKPTSEDDDDDWENPMAAQKALWKSWLEKKEFKDEPSDEDMEHYTEEMKKKRDKLGIKMNRGWDKKGKVRCRNCGKKTGLEQWVEFPSKEEGPSKDDGNYCPGCLEQMVKPKHGEKEYSKDIKAEEDDDKEKEVKSILEDAKRYGTGNPRASDMYKAEEGMGGMNMGAQRGLGHEAGYKQDPGQSAQITEVPEEVEEESEGEKTAKQIIGGGGIQEGLHLIGLSAYENHEQDESPETEPNKQQIPTSKPKTDVFKSLYKKALIIKYKNIYKPLNT